MKPIFRFIAAQETTYASALTEIKAGKKQGHWMWFIFPQLKALGYSANATYYGIEDASEALDYLENTTLYARLIEICTALLALPHNNIITILGSPDHLKLQSCLTLFEYVAPDDITIFKALLHKYYDGEPDYKTIELLEG